jgi:hypothetical protein
MIELGLIGNNSLEQIKKGTRCEDYFKRNMG